jgi:uncharacterized membrane protein
VNWLVLLLILHLYGAALWIGGMAFALLILRAIEAPEADRQTLHLVVFHRLFDMVSYMMPITLASGWIIAFLTYGRPILWPWSLNAMQTAGLAMGGLFLLIWFGPLSLLDEAFAENDKAEIAAQSDRIKRLLAVSCGLGGLGLGFGALLQY